VGVVGRGQRLPPTARKREAKKGGNKKRKREGVRRKETMRGRGKEKENGAKGGGGRSRQRLGGVGRGCGSSDYWTVYKKFPM
jgi:hypothetical protein